MKRTIIIAVLVSLVLGSCNFIGSIFNPIIGTWKTEILAVAVTCVINADDTFTDTNSFGSVGVTATGTWDSDGTTFVKTYSDESVKTYTYTFNSDKSQMTLSLSDGLSLVYTRQ